MRRIIALAIMLFSLTSTCFAINPLLSSTEGSVLPSTNSRWKLLYINTSSFVEYIDAESYHSYTGSGNKLHSNCPIVSSWFWRVRFKNSDAYHQGAIFEDTYRLGFKVYDLKCKTISIHRISEYDKYGNLVHDAKCDDTPESIIPDSIGEEIFESVKYYAEHR